MGREVLSEAKSLVALARAATNFGRCGGDGVQGDWVMNAPGATDVRPRRVPRWLVASVFVGLALSSVAAVGETYWTSLNAYEKSKVLKKTVGRKKFVVDLRAGNASSVLPKPEAVLEGGGSPMWTWQGAYDVHILLPHGRELRTDTLLITADIEGGEIKYLNMNGGTELTAAEVRDKLTAEVTLMKPGIRSDGADAPEAIKRWFENPAQRDSSGAVWIVRDRPQVIAQVRELMGSYIVQYEFNW